MDQEAVIETINNQGLCAVSPPMSPEQMAEVTAWMHQRPVWPDAHMPETARARGDRLTDRAAVTSDRFCLAMHDAIRAPHLFERAMELMPVFGAYLGATPLSYSSNAFWTRPGSNPHPDIQGWHRDEDDVKFLALFCYLTDVREDADGPHVLESPSGVRSKVFGPAGTMFLANTNNLHMGIKPTSGERGMWWWRCGVSDPPASYLWDKNAPMDAAFLGDRYPEDLATRVSLRLLVTPTVTR